MVALKNMDVRRMTLEIKKIEGWDVIEDIEDQYMTEEDIDSVDAKPDKISEIAKNQNVQINIETGKFGVGYDATDTRMWENGWREVEHMELDSGTGKIDVFLR